MTNEQVLIGYYKGFSYHYDEKGVPHEIEESVYSQLLNDTETGVPYPVYELHPKLLYEIHSFDGRFNISYTTWNYKNINELLKNKMIDVFSRQQQLDSLKTESVTFLNEEAEKTHVALGTIYNCSKELSVEKQRQADFGESIYGFQSSTWMAVFCFALILCALLRLHMIFNKRRRPSGLWTLFCHIMGQPNVPSLNSVSSCLAILFDTFVFFVVICYFGNGIKSDKVVTYQPDVYDDYRHIPNDPSVDVHLLSTWNQNRQIIYSLQKLLVYNKHIRHFNVKVLTDKTAAMALTTRITNTRIIIEQSVLMDKIKSQICNEVKAYGICMHIGYDAFNYDDMRTIFIRSKLFEKKKIFKKYMKYFSRSLATGLRRYQYVKLYSTGITEVTPDTYDCLSNGVITHDPEYSPFEISNYKYTFYALLIPFILSCLALNYERFIFDYLKEPFKIYYSRRRKVCYNK